MSIETVAVRMPQPEQWLSEHEPWSTVVILTTVVALAVFLGWWCG